jgi:hypothetical protein
MGIKGGSFRTDYTLVLGTKNPHHVIASSLGYGHKKIREGIFLNW